MKFYGRDVEYSKINSYWSQVKKGVSKILVIYGRRRIGKTRLALEAVQEFPHLYFFVTRKKITSLLQDWTMQIKAEIEGVYGDFRRMEDLLLFLFEYSRKNPVVVIFDEFQNFSFLNPEVYSIFQKVFDRQKDNSSLLFIFSGSTYSLIEKIFKASKEPLFGRASEFINLSYLSIANQAEFMDDEGIPAQKEKILLFSIFDGVPKYWEELASYNEKLFSSRLKKIFLQREWIWEEGENILKEEFGRDYASYFSILSAIAKGRRILSEIEQFTGIKEASVYLKKLETDYRLIERRLPVTDISKSTSRKGRYYLKDNFIAFWFAFIEPYRYLKEIGQAELAVAKIFSELDRYLGRKLEDMAIRWIIEENPLQISFTGIGGYWDRKGEVEIDVMLLDDDRKKAYLFEVKSDKTKLTGKVLEKLRIKATKIQEIAAYKTSLGYIYPEENSLKIQLIE